jgi:hypothetical protein
MIEEIEFKGAINAQSLADTYIPFIPQMVQMITQSSSKPPLSACKCETISYEVDNFNFQAFIHLKDIDGDWEETVPLSMCKYVKPSDGKLFDIKTCSEAAQENMARQRHNKFIIDLFCAYIRLNDCGTSAGKLTLPEPPPNFTQLRLDTLKALTVDKLALSKKAIKYLADHDILCERDYEFDDAFEKANKTSFLDEIKRKTELLGKVRVRLDGKRPTWWDGVSETDDNGTRVKWQVLEGHTFLSPNVGVVLNDEDVEEGEDIITDTDKQVVTLSTDKTTNPFDSITK